VTDNTLIEINYAKVLQGGTQIFENLNFSWEKGQHWAIIGNSGKELTSFLETLRGNAVISYGNVIRPYSHSYLLQKSLNGEVHSFRDLIAFVSQKYELKNRSNQQNFYFQQRFNASESEETSTVREYLKQVIPKVPGPWSIEKTSDLLNLNHLLDQSLLKLSNGETRRLVLALGLMRQPSIFLLDRPMTGLDAETRSEFGTILKGMIQSGIHVVLTTSPEEIPEEITHVAKLNGKGIAQTWTRSSFPYQDHTSTQLNWDWELLKKLISGKPSSIETLISLKEVNIRYGEKQILKNLTWEIKAGDRWLLRGANGTGKSTMISLLIGENPQAYAQNIWLFGRKRGSGESIWEVKKPIGFVAPELSRYFPANQTVKKVILSGLFDTMGLFKKVTLDQEAKAENWMKLFELESFSNHPITRITLENQRWTLLARALIKSPELLILDEASQGMDEFQRELFKKTIQKICELGTVTLIYVSHYQEDIPDAVTQIFTLGQE
jgi:molybdate transport system ATP-binding protein